MNIIYDEIKAKDDIKLYLKKERNKNLFALFLTIIGFIDIVLLILHLFKVQEIDFISFMLCVIFTLDLVFLILLSDIMDSKLSSAAQYHIIMENNNILDIVIDPGVMDTKQVILLIESNTGNIERTILCDVTCIENTRINDEILDIHQEILYIPYYKEVKFE